MKLRLNPQVVALVLFVIAMMSFRFCWNARGEERRNLPCQWFKPPTPMA